METSAQLALHTNSLALATFQGYGHVLWQKGTLEFGNGHRYYPLEDIQTAFMSIDNTGKAFVIWDEDARSITGTAIKIVHPFCQDHPVVVGSGVPHVRML